VTLKRPRIIERILKDDGALCRLTFLLVVLSLLGVDLPRGLELLGLHQAAATSAPRTVALDWKEAGPGRECQPVFEDGRGWRLSCRTPIAAPEATP
jgi:hypothetical protein